MVKDLNVDLSIGKPEPILGFLLPQPKIFVANKKEITPQGGSFK